MLILWYMLCDMKVLYDTVDTVASASQNISGLINKPGIQYTEKTTSPKFRKCDIWQNIFTCHMHCYRWSKNNAMCNINLGRLHSSYLNYGTRSFAWNSVPEHLRTSHRRSHSQQLQVLVKDPLVRTNDTPSTLETFSDSELYSISWHFTTYLLPCHKQSKAKTVSTTGGTGRMLYHNASVHWPWQLHCDTLSYELLPAYHNNGQCRCWKADRQVSGDSVNVILK